MWMQVTKTHSHSGLHKIFISPSRKKSIVRQSLWLCAGKPLGPSLFLAFPTPVFVLRVQDGSESFHLHISAFQAEG